MIINNNHPYTISKPWEENKIKYQFTQPYDASYAPKTCAIPFMKPEEFEARHFKIYDIRKLSEICLQCGNKDLLAYIVNKVGQSICERADKEGKTLLMSGMIFSLTENYLQGYVPYKFLLSLNVNVNCASCGGKQLPFGATPLWALLESNGFYNSDNELCEPQEADKLSMARLLLRKGAIVQPQLTTDTSRALFQKAQSKLENEKTLHIFNQREDLLPKEIVQHILRMSIDLD